MFPPQPLGDFPHRDSAGGPGEPVPRRPPDDDRTRHAPRIEDEPTFGEPWEAQAFSIAVALSERGIFTWKEWADVLAGVIAAPQSSALSYYEQWLLALEKLVTSRMLVGEQELAARREAWRAAALATPHGQPIVLPPD